MEDTDTRGDTMTTTEARVRRSSMQAANHASYREDWTSAPKSTRVNRVPLSAQQQGWIDQAWSLLDVQKAIELDVGLTNIYSPTGFEREVNNFIVDFWQKLGV